MSLWDYIKSKSSNDNGKIQNLDDLRYLLHKKIEDIEKVPLNYSKLKSIWDKINPLCQQYKCIIDRYNCRDKMVSSIFDNMLKKTGDLIISEKKPERMQELVNLYRETEEIKEDYKLRIGDWRKITLSLLDNEMYIKAKDLQELSDLEEKYAKYNDGRSLAAFNKAKEKLDRIMDEKNISQDAEQVRIENEQRLKEILNSVKRQPLNERFEVNSGKDEKANSGEKEVKVQRASR